MRRDFMQDPYNGGIRGIDVDGFLTLLKEETVNINNDMTEDKNTLS